ncbi:uncharacterized protein TNCV_2340231 [Trichonephila clavipes]|nr:uncharacterized protein TNCV_2340231 [Trichonephila clavipes]
MPWQPSGMVTNLWLVCHEFETSAAEDPPCRGADEAQCPPIVVLREGFWRRTCGRGSRVVKVSGSRLVLSRVRAQYHLRPTVSVSNIQWVIDQRTDRLTNTFMKDFCVRITNTFKKGFLRLDNEHIFGGDQGYTLEIMDEILTTARDLELDMNEDDIEELIMGHEDELTIEKLQEILNEEHQETQRNVSPEQEKDEREPMPTSAIKDLLKKWADVRAMVLEWHPNQADVSRVEDLYSNDAINYFWKILKKREKQSTLDIFFNAP